MLQADERIKCLNKENRSYAQAHAERRRSEKLNRERFVSKQWAQQLSLAKQKEDRLDEEAEESQRHKAAFDAKMKQREDALAAKTASARREEKQRRAALKAKREIHLEVETEIIRE